MSERTRINLIKYGSCAAFVVLFVVCNMVMKDFASADLTGKYLILCDGFTVPAVLMIMAGCLIWAEGEGIFYGISYAAKMAIRSLIPGGRLQEDERYGDYVARKREKKVKGYGFLFIAGAVTMVVALVFMALFYSQYN